MGKWLLSLSALLFMALPVVAEIATIPSGRYIVNRATWSAEQFSVHTGTVTSSFAISNLSSGQCVQTTTGGRLTTTGSACGSGGGTPGGSSNQVQYNSGGSFAGSNNFQFNGTSVTILGRELVQYSQGDLTDTPGLTINGTNFSGTYATLMGFGVAGTVRGKFGYTATNAYNVESNGFQWTDTSGNPIMILGESGTTTGDLTNPGGLHIGTTRGQNKLDVAGGVVIGSSFTTNGRSVPIAGLVGVKAPTDGLAVQGNVAIGTYTATNSQLVVQASTSNTYAAYFATSTVGGSAVYISTSGGFNVTGNAANKGNIYLRNYASLTNKENPAALIDIEENGSLIPVYIQNNGGATAIYAIGNGTGQVGTFENSGTGTGVRAHAANGIGLHASTYVSTAAYVNALSGGTGIAVGSYGGGRAIEVYAGSITLNSSQWTAGQFLALDSNKNVITQAAGSGTSPLSGFYLRDGSSVIWYVTVDTSGTIITTVVASAPAGTLYRTSVVVQDSSAAYWSITVNTSGNLVTAASGGFSSAIDDLILNDSTGLSWIVTVDTSGSLVTS